MDHETQGGPLPGASTGPSIPSAADLGRLPLALDHAAAYCKRTGMAFDAYTRLLPELIKRVPKGADYPRSVSATFSLAIEHAAAACAQAETLMGLFAFFAPDDIPLDLIGADVMSEAARADAVAALCEAALLDVEHDGGATLVSVHRLAQTVMRDRLAARGEAEATAVQALTLVAEAFPSGDAPLDVRSWPACAALRPHALARLTNAPEEGEIAQKTTLLLNQLALYFVARAEHSEAEPLMRRALAIDEAGFGPDHPTVAVDLNNLAQLLKATNRLAEAEPLMRRALEIDEAGFGSDHPTVAIRLNNLAQLLKATNRLAEAEPLMRRALAIDEAGFGPDHPTVAIDLNNLAQLLKATNRLAEAEPLMRRALAIDEAGFGPDHPGVARDLNNLAQLLKATNRLAEAEPLMRRALEIDEAGFGPGHPRVAVGLNNLAQLLQDTNRPAEAEPLMRRALAIFTASLGGEHPNTNIVAGNYRALLEEVEAAKLAAQVEASHPVSLLVGEGNAPPKDKGKPRGGFFSRLFRR
jgi:tetratricopeptide (TPR) repeat protein